MSTARVSSGSPTLERMEARQAEGAPKPSACRSLFGPVDHEQLRREFRGQLRQIREESQRRWEFDFAAGAPLPPGHQARFQWEEVDAAALPAFYRETLLPGAARRLLRRKSKAPAEGEEEEQERDEPATQPESDGSAARRAQPRRSGERLLLRDPPQASPGVRQEDEGRPHHRFLRQAEKSGRGLQQRVGLGADAPEKAPMNEILHYRTPK
nr:PREDICTED: cyclin-dependent kinase inhibitor 1C [Anolis carolinensis]|eukprot:XP_003214802.3 PREDICTED: cyclin-dependent kinase inhibitor 1C [Anolis carolinensis]